MKTKLTNAEKQTLLPNIIKVLTTGKPWEAETLHYPAGAIIDAILSITGMKKDTEDENSTEGFDTNGWQYDWWQSFTYKGKKYTLSGSGFYGGHAFELADE